MRLSTLVLVFALALASIASQGPAVAQAPPPAPKAPPPNKAAEKKNKEMQIAYLEAMKRTLKGNEKEVLHGLDVRADRIIKNLDPKEIRARMEETVKVVRLTRETISIGDYDYGGHRRAAVESLDGAERRLLDAIKRNTHVERKAAAERLLESHKDVKEALAYSIKKYGLGKATDVKPANEPETRAAANRQLAGALPDIEFAYYLLASTDHEIKDFVAERAAILKNRDILKQQERDQVASAIKEIDKQIKALKK